MGVVTYKAEESSPLSANRWFKAIVFEFEQLLRKVIPDIAKSVEVVQGDGGPGTIKKIAYLEDGKLIHETHKIEEVDTANLKTSYSVIEGDLLGDKLEKITNELTYVPSPNGGSVCKIVAKFYTKVDFEITEEQFKARIEKSRAILKPVEEYLLANPDVCN